MSEECNHECSSCGSSCMLSGFVRLSQELPQLEIDKMSEECNHECSSCGSSCDSRTKPESLQVAPHMGTHVKHVIGIVSGKGGVGKSLVTALLAVQMQRKGYKTAILDADITGPSIPKIFGMTEKATGDEHGIFPVNTKKGIEVMSINR